MSDFRSLVRLTSSAAVKEKRLAALLAERGRAEADLRAAVEDAQVRGSLELAGRPPDDADSAAALRRAQRAVDPTSPFTVAAVVAWYRSLTGRETFRTAERSRPRGPAPAPVPFIASRLEIVEQWLKVDSGRELKPAEQAALVYARLVEISPFDEANGHVALLAASHLAVRAGGRPPILVGADAPRLEQSVEAAFALHTEPLARLFAEASERALDVMLAALDAPR